MHSRTLARVEPALARSYASRDAEKARAFAARHGGAQAFGSYEAALASDDVTIAMIVTPPSSHLEWTLAALEAGKHVIVEKPAFLDTEEFDAATRAAERAGRQVVVAENYPYKRLANDLRWLLQEEPLGRVLFLNVNAVKQQPVEGWRDDPALSGGGALFEGGIHWVSLLAHLGLEVSRVRAASPARAGEPERSIQLMLRYEQGTVATLSYSWEVASPLKGLRLSRAYATDGSATFESNGIFFAATGRRWRLRAGSSDLRGYHAMFREILAALRTGTDPQYTLGDARRDVEIVAEAYRDAGLPPGRDADVAPTRPTDNRDREGGRT